MRVVFIESVELSLSALESLLGASSGFKAAEAFELLREIS